ncbi:MAG TPA: S9 family peptidase [Povalibacter sp.]|nr:S9 family peptidase [Povalibacter sp.]
MRHDSLKRGMTILGVLMLTLGMIGANADETAAPAEKSLPELISAEAFGTPPIMTGLKLSPDGRRIVALANIDDSRKIIVSEPGAAKAVSGAFQFPAHQDLLWYDWAGNDRILVGIGEAQRFSEVASYVRRLVMIDLSTSKIHFVGNVSEGIVGDEVIYVDPDGKSLLLNLQRSVYEYPSVWKVDLDSLEMTQIVKPLDRVWHWFADSHGVVRAGIGADWTHWWLLYRQTGTEAFARIKGKWQEEDDADGTVEKLLPAVGTDQGYVITNAKSGRFALYRYDFSKDTIGDVVYENPQVDIDDVLINRDGQPVGVHYTDDRSRTEWFDPELRQVQQEIDAALPSRINRVVSFSRDRQRMIISTSSASDPGRYYLYESASGVMRLLAKPYERIAGKALASVSSVSYTARDGVTIPAYLTVPRGRDVHGLPLIVMPHGGPYLRDEWGYDPWAQFLANRGYLVLQPNFRGSTGYGRDFVEKGDGQWGRGMQDDLDDGVKWLVDAGKADKSRVCIMGASFGGYAAMWAAARNPDIYRCAISLAGISDVQAMLNYDRSLFSARRYYLNWRDRVLGEKKFDPDAISPLKMVDRIAIPLLIAHGTDDDTVPYSQSKKLHDALKKAHKPHQFVTYDHEGHGFIDPSNGIDFLDRVEAFLSKYNPADAPAADAAHP